MKTRQGFVSNSSSSSYIIAVPKTVPTCKCCKRSDVVVLELLLKYLTTLTPDRNEMYTMSDASQVMEYFTEELGHITKSKADVQKKLATVKRLLKNKALWEDVCDLQDQLALIKYNTPIHKEYDLGKDRDKLEERKDRLEKFLADYDTSVKNLKEKISKIEKCIKEGHQVYAFTLDNWCEGAERMIKAMIADKVIVEVIEEIHT